MILFSNYIFGPVIWICNIITWWQVDLLKHGIPDPSSLTFSHPQSSTMGADKEKDKLLEGGDEYIAAPVFVHTRFVIMISIADA